MTSSPAMANITSNPGPLDGEEGAAGNAGLPIPSGSLTGGAAIVATAVYLGIGGVVTATVAIVGVALGACAFASTCAVVPVMFIGTSTKSEV